MKCYVNIFHRYFINLEKICIYKGGKKKEFYPISIFKNVNFTLFLFLIFVPAFLFKNYGIYSIEKNTKTKNGKITLPTSQNNYCYT